jgi:hypothetical protein
MRKGGKPHQAFERLRSMVNKSSVLGVAGRGCSLQKIMAVEEDISSGVELL